MSRAVTGAAGTLARGGPSPAGWLLPAVGARHGIVLPPVLAGRRPADPPGIHHASVTAEDGQEFASAGGGAATTVEGAATAAVAEALERYAAAVADLDERPVSEVDPDEPVLDLDDLTTHTAEQRADPGFPWPGGSAGAVARMTDLVDGSAVWYPAALVGLRQGPGVTSTSSGLAAHRSFHTATLRAAEELVERDALMATWLHGLPGRRVVGDGPGWLRLPAGSHTELFDLTPAYSPHPVALAAAVVPLLGRPRIGVGVACRSTWPEAADKALMEACQSVAFAAELLARQPQLWALTPDGCRTFDHHAVYYTANPDHWSRLPLRRGPTVDRAGTPTVDVRPHGRQVEELAEALAGAGVRLLHRDLTTPDLWQLGLRVVRVVSPDLIPLHHDHRFPHLGGTARDLSFRYPGGVPTGFPSPDPHPLG